MKTSLAEKVGCRPPWDIWSPTSIPVCETLEKNIEHEKLDFNFYSIEQKNIIKSTNCLIPCKYSEYKVVGEPINGNSTIFWPDEKQGYKFQFIEKFLLVNIYCRHFHMGFSFASTDVVTQKESLVYPPVSFISELGGSLGLFVGFSFLTIWDAVTYLMEKLKSAKDYC